MKNETAYTLARVRHGADGGPDMMERAIVRIQAACDATESTVDIGIICQLFVADAETMRIWMVQDEGGNDVGHILANNTTDLNGHPCVWVNQLFLDHEVPEALTDAFVGQVNEWVSATRLSSNGHGIYVYMSSHRAQDYPGAWMKRFGFTPHTTVYRRGLNGGSGHG